MKRTVRTRGAGQTFATARAKAVRPGGRAFGHVKHDPENARLRRLASLVRWVDGSQAPAAKPSTAAAFPAAVANEKRLMDAIETLSEGVALWDADDRLILSNARFRAFYPDAATALRPGASFERFLGETAGQVQHDPDTPSEAWPQRRLHAQGGRDGGTYEEHLSDGRWLLATDHATADGGRICIRRDITQRKRAEEEAREHQSQLMRYMRIASMGEMTAALAHELNQPIAAIANYCNGSLRRLASGRWTVEDLEDTIGEIYAEAKRARAIIQNVSRFVRKAPQARSVTEIGAVVASIVNLVRNDLRRHGIELVVDLADPTAALAVNVVEIEQTLLNLIRNSIESIVETPGSVRRIELRSRTSGQELCVCVRDHGKGFSEEMAKRAFDPFFTTKADGMGMGLAICRTIVEGHGGRIGAEPTGVHFTLPINGVKHATT